MKKLLLLVITIFLITINTIGQGVLINEFMSDNETTIEDKDGDFSDWIELYNTSDSAINLLNYSLSDDASQLNKWGFPQVIMLPHDFLLIFASGKNSIDTIELHSNFKISSSGEKIFLSKTGGVIIDQTISINLADDVSYGRIPDGDINWFRINTPSPARTNNYSNQFLFSNEEGFYTSSFYLKIEPLLNDTVFYTLNGSLPTENSNVFPDSILMDFNYFSPNIISEIRTSPEQNLISYKAWESPRTIIDKATVLRCASFRNGIRTSKTYTKTFFIDEEIFEKYTIPIISLVTDENNLFSSDSGIYVPGVNYDSTNPEWSGNYFLRGENWERPVHIEYFDNDGLLGFSQDAGIRIHGGKTRQAAQKSLRLYARNEYGKKYFNYQLLPQKEITEYKRFLLRTSMGAWGRQSIIRDVLAQDISRNLDIEYQDFRQVIVYINGEYWGIHSIRDRIDERFIEYTHGIDKDSVEFYEDHNLHYENILEYIESNDLSINSNYEYVGTQIDLNNYIDYTIAEQFFKNYDWPVNNIYAWRPNSNDGKWRWIFYDLDAGFGEADYNMLVHSTENDSSITWPNPPSSTFLFRNLLKNNLFQDRFISRYAEILNLDFGIKIMQSKLNAIKSIYEPEIPRHIDRWNFPDSYSSWEYDIEDEILYFIENRSCFVAENILHFFNLSDFGFICTDAIDNMEKELYLAPIPNKGNFVVYNSSTEIIDATIIIYNGSGIKVYNENHVSLIKDEYKYFNLSHLPSNMYVMQIVSNHFNASVKFLIIK